MVKDAFINVINENSEVIYFKSLIDNNLIHPLVGVLKLTTLSMTKRRTSSMDLLPSTACHHENVWYR